MGMNKYRGRDRRVCSSQVADCRPRVAGRGSQVAGCRLQVAGCRSQVAGCRSRIISFSINLLVVYRESVNLIGYLTRRLSADSLQL